MKLTAGDAILSAIYGRCNWGLTSPIVYSIAILTHEVEGLVSLIEGDRNHRYGQVVAIDSDAMMLPTPSGSSIKQ